MFSFNSPFGGPTGTAAAQRMSDPNVGPQQPSPMQPSMGTQPLGFGQNIVAKPGTWGSGFNSQQNSGGSYGGGYGGGFLPQMQSPYGPSQQFQSTPQGQFGMQAGSMNSPYQAPQPQYQQQGFGGGFGGQQGGFGGYGGQQGYGGGFGQQQGYGGQQQGYGQQGGFGGFGQQQGYGGGFGQQQGYGQQGGFGGFGQQQGYGGGFNPYQQQMQSPYGPQQGGMMGGFGGPQMQSPYGPQQGGYGGGMDRGFGGRGMDRGYGRNQDPYGMGGRRMETYGGGRRARTSGDFNDDEYAYPMSATMDMPQLNYGGTELDDINQQQQRQFLSEPPQMAQPPQQQRDPRMSPSAPPPLQPQPQRGGRSAQSQMAAQKMVALMGQMD